MEIVIDWFRDPTVARVFGIVFATLLLNYLARRLFVRLEEGVRGTENVWDDALYRAIHRPLGWLIFIVGISLAAEIVAHETDTGLAQLIEPVRYICVVGLLAMFLTRFVSELEATFVAKGADVTTSNAVAKLLRVSVMITALLTVLQTLGISVSGILAFGGIGGIAVGFAARDLLANFFGGLILYLDQPFKVGDWIRSPDRNIEGTVVKIGFRLTEIRTFDQRPLYIPNNVFANIAVENPSRMLNRRIYENIGIRYADIGKMKMIVDEVREMLHHHPDIAQDKTLIVNFNEFAASSINFMVYTFTRTTVWVEFHEVKERVLLQIIEIIESHGAEVAFPTTTVHLASPEPAMLASDELS